MLSLHRGAGLDDPTRNDEVRLALRAFARVRGTRPRQAAALGELEVAAILETMQSSDVRDLRDRALLLVARDLLSRRSELIALDVDDVTREPDGSATVLIWHSKTDPFGDGTVCWLSPRALAALDDWLATAGIVSGALFRSVGKAGRVGGRLSDRDVARRFKVLAGKAGLDATRISGHSTRVGMTQDLVRAGAELPVIMQAGRWRTAAMPARYAERLLAGRGGVAQYYGCKATSVSD